MTRSFYRISLLLFIAFVFNAYSQLNHTDEIKSNIKYLSSQELRGRFPGDEGIEKAAVYIEESFKANGLKPLGNSYRQEFFVTTALEPGDSNDVYFNTIVPKPGLPRDRWRPVRRSFELNTDYVPIAFSENGSAKGPLAFAGYGISAPELNYDDYAGFDASGKILVIITETPEGTDEKSKFKAYNSMRYKATTARNKGAAGIIFVRPEGDSMNVFYRLSYSNMGKNSGVVAIHSNRHSVDKFFPKSKKLVDVEKEIIKTLTPNTFDVEDVEAYITVDLKNIESPTHNIIGMIEGTDSKLKDEFIVIGAHYDHLGFGGPSSRYNGQKELAHVGADDNASGTAMVMQLAKVLSENPTRRSIVLMAFSGEEMGLLGSEFYTKQPMHDLDNTLFMLNIDMVGRLRDKKLSVFGVGTAKEFSPLAEKISEEMQFNLTQSIEGHGSSDHASFYRAGVPVVNLFTGIHEDYHTPNDTWDKINYNGMLEVMNFAEAFVREIDANDAKPEFIKVEEMEKGPSKNHSYASVWFGIVPGFDSSDLGCKISGTSPGSPAHKAGLKENDIITRIDATKILNLHDFMYKIREHKPGDELEVEVLRGENYDEKVIMKVTLVAKEQ